MSLDGVSLTQPVVLRFDGAWKPEMCAQAQYEGPNAVITLQNVDMSGQTPLQLWQVGNDGRIYLYTPSAPATLCLTYQQTGQPGQPLELATANPQDQTQVWNWNQTPPSIINVGASGSGKAFAIDNNHGSTSPGNQVQLYVSNGTNAQAWLFQTVPMF